MMLSILSYLSSLVKRLFRSFAHFLNWITCFLFNDFWVFFIYSRYKSSIVYMLSKHFLPFWWRAKSLMFSSRNIIFLDFTLRFVLHFELIFLYGARCGLRLIVLHWDSQSFQYHLLKRLSFFYSIVFGPLQKINWPYMWVCFWIFVCVPSIYVGLAKKFFWGFPWHLP